MFENFNLYGTMPVYTEIVNHIQFAVASGRLKEGERLPSVRALGKMLQIHFALAAIAYRDLEIMGLVDTRHGMGTFVAEDAGVKCREKCRRRFIERLHEVVAEAKAAGMTQQEIKAICAASYAAECDPYVEVPDSLLALVNGKGN